MTNELNPSLQDLDDRIEARVQAIRAERDWWPCHRGCDHCCRHLAHPPELSAAEWDRVDAAIEALPSGERLLVEQQVEALLQQIAEQTLTTQVVCPYLNQAEGICRIYQARPIACRTYGFFVARSHDQYCQQIETAVQNRGGGSVIWGNAETIRAQVEQTSGPPISFVHHYRDRWKPRDPK